MSNGDFLVKDGRRVDLSTVSQMNSRVSISLSAGNDHQFFLSDKILSSPNDHSQNSSRWAYFFHLPISTVQFAMQVTDGAKTQAYIQKTKDLLGVYCIALNRPDAKNALSRQLLKDLDEAVALATSNPS